MSMRVERWPLGAKADWTLATADGSALVGGELSDAARSYLCCREDSRVFARRETHE